MFLSPVFSALALTAVQWVGGVILLLASLALIIIIVGQEGKDAGLGSIDGGADTFLSKNTARKLDTRLKRITTWVAIGFGIIIIALNILNKFGM